MIQMLVLISLFLIPAYIFRFSIVGIPTNVFEIAVLVTFIYFVVSWIRNNRQFPQKYQKLKFGSIFAYLLLLASFISIFVADDRTRALGIFKGWFLVPIVLYFIIINTFDRAKIKYLSIPLYFSLITISFWAVLQKLGVISTLFYQVEDLGFADYLARFRAFGPFESPNYLAMFVVPMIFLSLPILELVRRRTDQILILTTFIFPLYALYASHSLGGLLAIGFATVSFLVFRLAKEGKIQTREEKRKLLTTILGLIIVAVIFSIIFSSISQETYSRNIRMEIYRYAGQLITTHPILGIGPGEFQQAVESISKSNAGFQLYGLSYALHPHNVYLAFWLNLGIAGLLFFLILLIYFFVKIGRSAGGVFLTSTLCAAMLAILVHGIVDTTYFKNDLSAIFWLILAQSLIVGAKNGQPSSQ